MGIIQPIANFFGMFMNLIFEGCHSIGIGHIGIAIILMTVIIKCAMLPLTISQQKTSKIAKLMQPELKAVRARYRGMNDDASKQMLNEEIRQVYAKYGASQTGGCIQLVIQLPILFALYQVFRNIPDHIMRIREVLVSVCAGIAAQDNYQEIMTSNFPGLDWTNVDRAVDQLNAFQPVEWEKLQSLFPGIAEFLKNSAESLTDMNSLFGLNMAISPNQIWGWAILVPIIAGVLQFFSGWLSQNNAAVGDDKGTQISQKLMVLSTPIISVIVGFGLPMGLGVYWAASAGVQIIQQLIINAYFDKIGAEKLIQKSIEKRQKKMAKKGITQEDLMKRATINTKSLGDSNSIKSNSMREKVNFATKAANIKNTRSSSPSTSGMTSEKTQNNQSKEVINPKQEESKLFNFLNGKKNKTDDSISKNAKMVMNYNQQKKSGKKKNSDSKDSKEKNDNKSSK